MPPGMPLRSSDLANLTLIASLEGILFGALEKIAQLAPNHHSVIALLDGTSGCVAAACF